MSELKVTPVHDSYEKYGAKMVEFGGFHMPIQFDQSIIDEHLAVRKVAGLFDISHMCEFEVTGSDAVSYLNLVLTNNVATMVPGQVVYSFICNQTGGVVDDLTVYCFHKERFWLVANASNTEKDLAWLLSHQNDYDVTITNLSDSIGLLAIQGPASQEILQHYTTTDLSTIRNFTFQEDVLVDGKKCVVSRTGYTGEDGFELYCADTDVDVLFNTLLSYEDGTKKPVPIGLGARDTLRFEAGMPLYGNELGEDIPATYCGFNFAIQFSKDNFIGKEALLASKAHPAKKLIGLELTGKGIPRHGYPILKDGVEVGVITTGYLSPSLNKPIALAYVDPSCAIGDAVQVRIRNKDVDGVLISKKFPIK